MSTAVSLNEMIRPRLRAEIIFGPPQRQGAAITYLLKDRSTGWFYRIGVREYFLLSRMDGSRSLEVLGEEYAAAFGRSMNPQSWQGLFRLLEQRQLLVGGSATDRLEALKQERARKDKQENRGLFRRRFPLLNPDRFLTVLSPGVRFAYTRAFVLPAALCIVALEAFVLYNWHALLLDAWSGRNPPVLASYLGLVILFMLLHELAHGLTCKRFGGSVREIGLLWRYMLLVPYCKIDDAMLFHNRWQRVATSCAGVFVNLLLLVPFGLLWQFAPLHSGIKALSALLLLWFNASIFLNLLPFVELDGYFMLNHALDMVDLRRSSYGFWRQELARLVLRRRTSSVTYARRERVIYRVYGLLSLLVTIGVCVGVEWIWFTTTNQWLGPFVAWGLVLLIALVMFLRGPGRSWIKRVRSRQQAAL
jgi:putative peptide zinc metalloprotease protein